jgi:predicted O-methyltransferase YrrM
MFMKSGSLTCLIALTLTISGGPGLSQETGAPARQGQRPPPRAAGATSSRGLDFKAAPLPKDEAERKVLEVLDEMDVQQRRGMLSVPRDDGRLLRLLAESVGAKNIVEVGTSHGYSAIWMCLALRATGGKLTTFEIDKDRIERARQNFKRAGVEGLVTLVEGDAHQEVTKLKEPIDLLFLDADKEGYLDYLNKLLPLVRGGGLIVAHNMTARQADARFVKAIAENAALDTLYVTTGNEGIAVMLKKR